LTFKGGLNLAKNLIAVKLYQIN